MYDTVFRTAHKGDDGTGVQTISEAKDKVAKLWGKPKAKDTEYRLMKYHLRCDTEDGVLLHNVMTGELVLLDRDEVALLNELPEISVPAEGSRCVCVGET